MFLPALSTPDFIVIITLLVAGSVLLFYKPLTNSSTWRATVTPLASIMGSGFLVCAPILYKNAGNYAVAVMAGLLCVAYATGSVIRFNIKYAEPLLETLTLPDFKRREHRLHASHRAAARQVAMVEGIEIAERISHMVLAGAYCVSVSYYLQLLASFALFFIHIENMLYGRMLVTAILVGIGITGYLRGLQGIERLERVVVGVNLSMITALIAALAWFNWTALTQGQWHVNAIALNPDTGRLARLVMGLLIVVQGFETSRFLGSEHPGELRIRTMRLAQFISSLIYLAFLALMALVVSRAGNIEQTGITAIVTLSAIVSTILPALISITAIFSQFSAATADDAGCSGLLESIIRGHLPGRYAYLMVSAAAIALTWLTDVYEIISFASRAFAVYYAMQCIVALLVARSHKEVPSRTAHELFHGAVLVICTAVAIFGIPAE